MYPFIDIAVHEAIRKYFSVGEPVIIVTADFENIIWANGPSAQLFGFQSIYDFIEEGRIEGKKVRKKLREAASQLLNNDVVKTANLQIYRKSKDQNLDITLEHISLPKHDDAMLVIFNNENTKKRDIIDVEHIISGLDDTGACVAVLGHQGQILGATDQYYSLDISISERKSLVIDTSKEHDRLVKRLIGTARGDLPSAIGYISEDPAMFLQFVIDEIADEDALVSKHGPVGDMTASLLATDKDDHSLVDIEQFDVNEDLADPRTEEVEADDRPSAQDPSQEPEQNLTLEPSDAASFVQETNDMTQPEEGLDEVADFTFNPKGRAIRFVWKTDAASIFTEISPELADAVGPNAANIIGRRFSDVAMVFNLNPSDEILDLIRRRDTWSGKTVMWPVQGTDLVVPVDLAALPTYTRDRLFDGYRGFGVARIQEAVKDDGAIGFALVDGPHKPRSIHQTSVVQSDVVIDEGSDKEIVEQNTNSQDPFNGEVPAVAPTDTPGRRKNDKVVQLQELRQEAKEKLSEDEQAAFFKIRSHLNKLNDEFHNGDATGEEDANIDIDDVKTSEITSRETEDISSEKTDDSAGDDDYVIDEFARQEIENLASRRNQPTMSSDNDDKDTTDTDASDKLVEPVGMIEPIEPIEPVDVDENSTNNDSIDNGGTHKDDNNRLDESDEDNQDLSENELSETDDASEQEVTESDETLVTDVMANDYLSLEENDIDEDQDASDAEIDANLSLIPDDDEQLERLKVKIADLTSILETATDGVVIIDEDNNIQSLNASASALFDYGQEETAGKPFAMLFAPESQNAILDYMNAMSEHGVASILNDGREVLGQVSSGGTLPLSMTMGRLSGSHGYCAVLRDITQSKFAEEELRTAKHEAESANSHKTDFLARVSHEIRTPLNAIIGFSDLISQEQFGPVGHSRYIEYANDISKSGRHVLDIVNDLLDISKIEAGQQEFDFKSVSLNDEVTGALSILHQIANDERVLVRSSLPPTLPKVVADSRSIKQILINIISNSIRHTSAGGQIVISTSLEPNGSVLLRVRDNGIGMSRDELDRAMQAFGQAGQDTRSKNDGKNNGTGLGLPLTKAMTEANRAKFDIVSSPGEGTLVTIHFPPQRVLAE